MTRTKFEFAQVAAAFSLPLLLVAVAGWISWTEAWQRAEGELYRTADGAAEYAERMISSAVLAGRLTNSLLAGASDEEIRLNEADYHARLAQIMPDLPGAITIAVSDRNAQLMLMSTELPAPTVSLADREWVQVLQSPDPPALHVGPLVLSALQGQLFFSVSIPRTGSGNALSAGAYDGLINISLNPFAVAAGLANTTHEPTDVIALVRADGEILSTTQGLRYEMPRLPAESRLRAYIDAGETRGHYEGRALGLRDGIPVGRGLSIAFRQVGELPVYVTVSRSPEAVSAAWRRTLAGLLAVGIPASLALGFLSLTALRRRRALQISEAELDASFDSAATGTALIDGPSRRFLKVNRRLCDMTGRDAKELLGMTLDELVEPASDLPDPADAPAEPVKLQCPNGSFRWVECATAVATRDSAGAPALLIATIHDVTERKESEERQALLAREVDHRAKNVLAIVQAVIRLAREPDAGPFAEKIEGRIRALARAHELLARDRWQGADLMDLIRDELAPYQDGARITISGSAVLVAAAAVQPLSMALHELATNAVKHGALGRDDGGLSISWSQSREGRLKLVWEEQASKTAARDMSRRGAGLNILRATIEQLDGTVALDWREMGLCCWIDLPVEALADAQAAADEGAEDAANGIDPADPAHSIVGARVLLAEDEAVLAMDIQETLEDLGCNVVGPATTLDAAERLARQTEGRLDAAILDVNMKGATTLELARQLSAAGVPCIFVTGYSELPPGVGDDWQLLRKPVGERQIEAALREALARTPEMRARSESANG